MEDLAYVFSLAFSGSDLSRALWFGLVGSLFCSSRFPPARVFAIVFLLDRIWPFIGMALSGYGMGEIMAAVSYAFRSLPADTVPLLIRALGLYVLIGAGYSVRLLLHGRKPVTKPVNLTLPY